MESFNEYKVMVESEQITSVRQAVEIIANLIKSKLGTRTTKLKNYGYYSFALTPEKNSKFNSELSTAFATDKRFTFKEIKSHKEYSIVVNDLPDDEQIKFKLTYESTKSGSKLVLDLDLD